MEQHLIANNGHYIGFKRGWFDQKWVSISNESVYSCIGVSKFEDKWAFSFKERGEDTWMEIYYEEESEAKTALVFIYEMFINPRNEPEIVWSR